MANTFTDAAGRTWDLRLTIGHRRRLQPHGFDPWAALSDPKQLDSLNDPDTLGRVLWVLCEDQAAKLGVPTAEQFADGFDGPTIGAAFDALLGALADFTLRPSVAPTAKATLAGRIRAAEEAAVSRMGTAATDPTPASSTGPSGPSPGSPDSIPAP